MQPPASPQPSFSRPVPQSTVAEAPGSDTYISDLVASSPENVKVRRLRQEQARLAERRARLTELQALDDEKRRVQEQLDARMGHEAGGQASLSSGLLRTQERKVKR